MRTHQENKADEGTWRDDSRHRTDTECSTVNAFCFMIIKCQLLTADRELYAVPHFSFWCSDQDSTLSNFYIPHSGKCLLNQDVQMLMSWLFHVGKWVRFYLELQEKKTVGWELEIKYSTVQLKKWGNGVFSKCLSSWCSQTRRAACIQSRQRIK